ncbi:GxxExxY protein [Daejeonella sp.]|uniref:GxxExxY protein n=1 Tax=Daejeonella sp. TaxID=2805397 RepID=UPI00272621B8|nr:GxxExxY protein [Daejeonella sp.]MDO8993305.1 GxxExxY protein [Daejeonella sp.]MDP2412582.1 GxxExxY protein [Daejeonella sp.]
MITQRYLDELTYVVVGAAIEVHKIMGRGLLESVYHQCLKEELALYETVKISKRYFNKLQL